MEPLQLTIDPEQITVGGFIALEDFANSDRGQIGARAMRDLLANFVQGPDGSVMNYAEAQERITRLTLSQLKGAFQQLVGAFNKAEADAIPPAQAGGSA